MPSPLPRFADEFSHSLVRERPPCRTTHKTLALRRPKRYNSPVLHIGSTISHYKLVSQLGEGGMGVVYKAEDTKLERTVALKFLAQHLLNDEEAKERFLREAKAAAALHHPNVCPVHEIDEVDGKTFIAMAFLGWSQAVDATPGAKGEREA